MRSDPTTGSQCLPDRALESGVHPVPGEGGSSADGSIPDTALHTDQLGIWETVAFPGKILRLGPSV